MPESGIRALDLVTFDRLARFVAGTKTPVVDRQLWFGTPKDHGIGRLPSASLARFALCRLTSWDWLRKLVYLVSA